MSRPLLTHLEEIQARLTNAASILLCLDFDGTLAPIMDDPAHVRLSAETRALVRALGGKQKVTVAIISGRARDDLQERVNIPGLIYAGNHGLEISGPGFVFLEPASVECRPVLQTLAADLSSKVRGLEGVWVEDKGLTLSVHYRKLPAERHEEVRRLVHGVLAATPHPYVLTSGAKVFEIRPRADWTKGAAVHWIMKQLEIPEALVIFMGDDTTDEDAFAELATEVTIKVGNGAPTGAQYALENQRRVDGFLEWLVRQVS